MRKVLEASVIYRFLTVAAAFIDRQWSKSFLSVLICGTGKEKNRAVSIPGRIAAWLHKIICAVFSALRFNRLFDGSIFARSFLWCALAAAIAPIAPTMAALAAVLAGAASVFINFGCNREKKLFYSPVNKWIYLFAAVYLICTITSVTRAASLKGGVLTATFVLFAVALQNSVKKRSQVDTLIYLLVAAGMVVSLYGFLQVYTGVESTTDWIDEDTFSSLKLRVYSTLDNPNVLAEYLLLVIPLGVTCVFTAKTAVGRISATVASGAMLGCMLLTYSRGGWLGLIFSAALFLVIIDRRFIVLGAAAMIGLVFVLPDSIMSRFTSITDLSDSSTSYRIYIWLGTLEMLKDYWFCGVGTGGSAFTAVYPAYSYNAVSAPHAHNLYLQITAECGVCGIFAFLGCICSYVRAVSSAIAKKKDRKTYIQLVAALSGMGGFLLQAMTDHSFYNYRVTLMFWVMIALGTLLAHDWKEEETVIDERA